jgi:hypothetical protein
LKPKEKIDSLRFANANIDEGIWADDHPYPHLLLFYGNSQIAKSSHGGFNSGISNA